MNNVEKDVDILFDSGAGISVMSKELFPELVSTKSHKVYGIGGVEYAGEPVECRILISSTWETKHLVKPMPIPDRENLLILGRDFLQHFGTTEFDWTNQRVRIGEDWVFMVSEDHTKDITSIINRCKIGQDLAENQKESIKLLLEDFCQVFVKNSKAPKLCTTELHRIFSRDDRVSKDKVRRIPDKWKNEVNQQVIEMLNNGIIRPSKSPYNSNPLLVTKQDNTKRFVIDFRNLNKNTIQDSYPLPDVNDMIDACLNCNYFTQLDLASGYWCLEVHEDDKKKTSFSVPNGKYEFNRMPFGLKNSQATFQRNMDKMINDLKERDIDGVGAFSDNVFIFSETFEEHLYALTAVLEEVEKYNLSLKPEKCEFGFKEIDFLGFHIRHNEVLPRKDNVQKLIDFPIPQTKKQVQRLLGIGNFNRRFVPKYAEITKPLTMILSDKDKFVWGDKQQQALDQLIDSLTKAPALGLPDFSKCFYIQSDASEISVGGVLFQKDDKGRNITLGYHSKTLQKCQRNWKVTELELFAIKECSRKWDVYCSGKVIFITDHEPLKFIRNHQDNRGKIVRWLLELESIDYTIEYIKGEDNEIADALSRVEIRENPVSTEADGDEYIYHTDDKTDSKYCDIEKIKKFQKEDKALRFVVKKLEEQKKINKGPFRNIRFLHIEDDVLKRGERIVIPEKLQREVVDELHGQYHSGAENTVIMVKSRFWWRRMTSQIENWVRDCQSCAACKRQKTPKAELIITPAVPNPRESISIDVASMPISPRGKCCFLLIVDLATRFISVASLSNQKAETLKEALWDKWLSIFSIPIKLRSDQGANVNGNVINNLCDYLGIAKEKSSPYHPEGNGLAERSIGSVKSLVSVICESRKIFVHDWDLIIYEAVLAHNNTVNKSLKYSPFLCMFADHAQLPVDNYMGLKEHDKQKLSGKIIMQNAGINLQEAKIQYKEQHDKKAVINTYSVNQEVMMKRNYGANPKIAANWKRGPYTIDKKMGPSTYAIKGPKGGIKVYHHNNLMPIHEQHEASKTASYNMTTEPQEELIESTPTMPQINSEQNLDEDLSSRADPSEVSPLTRALKLPFNKVQVDMTAFRDNVMNIPQEDMAAFSENISHPTSPTTQHSASPTIQHPASPTTQHSASPTIQHPASPTTQHSASPTIQHPASPTTPQPTSESTVRSSGRIVCKPTFYGVDEQKQTDFYDER